MPNDRNAILPALLALFGGKRSPAGPPDGAPPPAADADGAGGTDKQSEADALAALLALLAGGNGQTGGANKQSGADALAALLALLAGGNGQTDGAGKQSGADTLLPLLGALSAAAPTAPPPPAKGAENGERPPAAAGGAGEQNGARPSVRPTAHPAEHFSAPPDALAPVEDIADEAILRRLLAYFSA